MKKYLISGLIILVPIVLTIMLFSFLLNVFTAPFLTITSKLLIKIGTFFHIFKNPTFVTILAKIIIILLICILIFLLGIVARWFLFKSLINLANNFFSKIPIIKIVYKSTKDILSSITSHKRKAFTRTVMIPFLSETSYCIGFETGEAPEECEKKTNEKLIPVFIASSPYPICNFFILVPKDQVKNIDMKNEDSVKYIVSCGLILPEDKTLEKHEK